MSVGEKIGNFKLFMISSFAELKKVSWPPKKETLRAAYAVVSFVIVLSVILGVIDYLLAKIVNWIVG